MTNLEAIKGLVNYPLPENTFKLALVNRELTESDEYSTTNKRALELAQADLCKVIITSPNIMEADYQLSLTAKSELRKLASGIYTRHGEKDPFKETITISNGTNRW